MRSETATAIASGVGPLIAASIGAYQLWLKPRVEEPRDLPFDLARLESAKRLITRIRLQLFLFTVLVGAVTLIPVGGTVAALLEVDFGKSISLPKVIVAFVATIGVVHVLFLTTRLRAISEEVSAASDRIARTRL